MKKHLRLQKLCNLCDEMEFELVSKYDRNGQELRTEICTNCGLVSHRDIPTEEELAEFYATEYRQKYHGETIPTSRRVMRAWKNGQRLLRRLSPCLNPGSHVLEVGAGIGCTVKAFQERGWAARGIEPHLGFQSFAQQRLRANVTAAYLFDMPRVPSGDLVLLIDVIEHFSSPRAAMDHLHYLVRPGGRLYVECPNLGSPFATRRRLFHFAHIHNFTPDTLEAMGRRCGFEIEQSFGAAQDWNLQVLFRRVREGRLEIDPQSYERTREALDRYNTLTYHLRWRYINSRVSKLAGYVDEYLHAKQFVPQILDQPAPVYEEQAIRRAA